MFENQYFPCVNWFKISFRFSYIEISECETFQKMTFKNRCVVAGSNGRIQLSVPILHGREQKMPMKEVKIAQHENWARQHWRTLVSCYAKSPFWEYYADRLETLFARKDVFLFDWNIAVLETILPIIDKKMRLNVVADGWPEQLFGSEFRPNNFQNRDNQLVYPQLFEDRIGFQPNLSIIDLLCMEGPNAKHLLLE